LGLLSFLGIPPKPDLPHFFNPMQVTKGENGDFYLHSHGYESGPFTLSKLREMYEQKIISSTDLIWQKGMPEWKEVGHFIGRARASALKTKSPAPAEHYTPHQPSYSSTTGVSYTPVILLGMTVVFIVSYMASPFIALHDLKRALESGDAGSLQERIDFPAIRQSLKEQIKASFMEGLAKDNEASALSTGLAVAFGPLLIDSIVDSVVTPAGISNLIWNAKFPAPSSDGKPLEQPPEPQETEPRHLNISYAWFSGLTTFKVISKNKDLVLRFHLKNFKWKLYNIDLPKA
jgi:hypothetical protein